MNDKRLIQKIKQKDEQALLQLIEKYSPYISTVVRNVSGSAITESDVEEITANVFIKIWDNSQNIDSSTLRSYLAVIARNMAIDRLRRLHYTLPYEEIVLADDTDIESDTERHILNEELRAALNEVKPKNKELLLRYYFYCQNISQIAKEMEMSESACKTALLRARKELKSKLTERGYFCET